ncbi:hypothetical protein C7R88_05740 [Plesiomonas shigelloides]|uniref:YagK/YfjJ domain-containing protein n=1 Tax=Plesiomonas shigelloides TaxID=703 RepID=UPI000D11DDA5|nr:inovirus-type Gp2 protein [Plesiomonas shigelloides]AVQ86860.1 hypothetical protein C7R88_05740 [Plesiomonas shigelloides]
MSYNFQRFEGTKRKAGERYAHSTSKPTYTWRGATYPINTGHNGEYFCYTDILSRALEVIHWALNKYRRILLVRYDLHAATGCKLPCISNMYKNLMRKLERKYGESAYFWVREIERAKELHYHCFLVLDGDRVRSTGVDCGVFEIINSAWSAEGGAHAHLCDTTIFINSNEKLNQAVKSVSYLAKVRGKAYLSSDEKNYNASQIKNRKEIKPFVFDERVHKSVSVGAVDCIPVARGA